MNAQTLICGMNAKNAILFCPNSVKCLIFEKKKNILFKCPLKNEEKCIAQYLKKEIKKESLPYWNYIKEVFSTIPKKEQKQFLSLSFFGIGKYFAANGFRFPKDWPALERIVANYHSKPNLLFLVALQDLWEEDCQESEYSELFLTLISNDFKNFFLSERSQRAVIAVIFCLKKAIIDESIKMTCEEEEASEKLIKDIINYILKSHLN